MDYNAQNVEYAVSVFYNGEPSDQAAAHTWLTTAQRVPEAWNFVWELLQPTKGTEVQFYAATTLHTKILRCWNEVPPESYDQLQEKLLQAVFAYARGPKIVTNRLCISLAAFILQQGTVDLAAILRPLSSEENTSLLLEVLTVIPEEYNSMTMGSSLRSKNRAALRGACTAVLDDMLRYLQSVYNDYSKEPPSEEVVQSWNRAASCACSWLTIDGEDTGNYGPTLPDRLPLCRALLTVVHVLYTCNEMVSDTALDACEACLAATRAAGGAGDATSYPNAAMQLLGSVADLATPIMAKDDVPNSPNEELLSAIITCCVALGSTHSRSMVEFIECYGDAENSGLARRMLQVLLQAQAAPGHYPIHETRSNLVFGFWYTLQDEILGIMESKTSVNGVWREVFSQLLTVLVVKSEAPSETALCKDDLELLRCYRQDIADSLMYCFAILGEWCWATVEAAYVNAAANARREAALHVFLALADAAPHERAPLPLTNMLQHAVQQANTTRDKRTLNTALDCLGSYASWLSSVGGARSAELGRECVRAAGAALTRCPASAALALRKLCADCTGPAAELAPDIVQAAQNSRGEEAWTRRQLVGAAGAALTAAEPDLAIGLLRNLAETLHADLTAQAQEPTVITGAADCAAALIAALTSRPELCAELFRLLAPTLPPFALHPNLVEPMFNILKQVVSALLGDCLTLMGQVAELTISAFHTAPCAAGLDVVKMVVILIGNEWPGARAVLYSSVSCSAREISRDASSRSDLTEALFIVLTAITKKRPAYLDWLEDVLDQLVELGAREIGTGLCSKLFLLRIMVNEWPGARAVLYICVSCSAREISRDASSRSDLVFIVLTAITKKLPAYLDWLGGVLDKMVELGCSCVRMWEACAARAACVWLAALTAHRPAALQARAPDLTQAVLRCIGGATPRNQIEPLAELLLALNRASWPTSGEAGLAAWLRTALAPPGFPTVHATDTHKHKFIAAVIKEKSSKRRLLETVQEFSLVCRGLVGTEYARQSIAAKQLVT